ncbi:MAG: hypothetical protein F6K41_09395 [Symploca sp. SIO3E6]|nr:hypothetical protein [Caldora sp. SIO3E6]
MFNLNSCQSCRYYQPTGRRGGMCQLLAVPVKGDWKACSCSALPFVSSINLPSPVVQKSNPELIPVVGMPT